MLKRQFKYAQSCALRTVFLLFGSPDLLAIDSFGQKLICRTRAAATKIRATTSTATTTSTAAAATTTSTAAAATHNLKLQLPPGNAGVGCAESM